MLNTLETSIIKYQVLKLRVCQGHYVIVENLDFIRILNSNNRFTHCKTIEVVKIFFWFGTLCMDIHIKSFKNTFARNKKPEIETKTCCGS